MPLQGGLSIERMCHLAQVTQYETDLAPEL
jgi:hypothetical protein